MPRILFVQNLQTKRPMTLWRYSVSARGLSKPTLVYNETDPAFSIGLQQSRSGQHIFLYASSAVTTSITMLDAANPTGALSLQGSCALGEAQLLIFLCHAYGCTSEYCGLLSWR